MAAPVPLTPMATMTETGKTLTNRWLALALLVLVAILNYADRFLISGLAQPIKTHFGIGDAMMGLLMGPAFALLYTLFTLPIARLADRRSRIMIIAGGCGVWSFFTMLSGMATSATMLALARVGVGIGEAAFQAPAAALIAAYFPVHERGRAFALLGTAIYVGQMMGLAGGPAIAAASDWQTAFHALGIAGIVVAIATFIIIREPARDTVAHAAPVLPLTRTIRLLIGTPSVRFLATIMALGSLSGVTFGMWGPALFERAYGMTTQAAGTTFALSFGLPGLLGVLGFGVLADKLGKDDPTVQLRLTALALGGATTMILAVTWTNSLFLAQMFAIPAGLMGGGWSVGVLAGLQYLLPNAHRATGTALVLLISSMFATVLGPVMAGQLSDWIAGTGPNGLRIGLSVAIPTGYIGVWAALRTVRRLEDDKAALAGA
ncbi:MAG: MFS transporter [Novosphingobium sp. 32-60-15]|uniref:MFS transporter n=1 Tax=unclassified Novosphingobium TaxID=2644732 RepID=UPI000BDBA99C|nr:MULTISPECIES: MFS transporter [unclassified Novosphingobium]OYX64700.1 MAG: MFS transporter [Novosphingobium sp. 32-60-15]